MSSVLVIDDDLALCRIIQRMLSAGYKVQTSQSVADAVAAIDQKSFVCLCVGLQVAGRFRTRHSGTDRSEGSEASDYYYLGL
jgi:DNA-binding NtrC family response regulator